MIQLYNLKTQQFNIGLNRESLNFLNSEATKL